LTKETQHDERSIAPVDTLVECRGLDTLGIASLDPGL
jgi:hypothetical protein